MIKKHILPGGHYNNTITILQSSTGTSIKNMIKKQNLPGGQYNNTITILQSSTGTSIKNMIKQIPPGGRGLPGC